MVESSEDSERFDEIVLRDSSEESVVTEEGLRLVDIVEALKLGFVEPRSLLQVLFGGPSCLLEIVELTELDRDFSVGFSHELAVLQSFISLQHNPLISYTSHPKGACQGHVWDVQTPFLKD